MVKKHKHNINTGKLLYRAVFLLILLVAGVVVYLVWDNYFNDNKKYDSSEPEIVEQAEQIDNKEREEKRDEEEDEKKVKQYEGEDPNEANELSGAVTFAGVVSDKVMIRANIDQYLGDGSCQLDLIDGNDVVYEEIARITSTASTATCEGFDIPLSEVGGGSYKIIIRIEFFFALLFF